ncbi:hypothetical protein AFLA_012607 [Aspergillus flavus NRRL3357]|nr:hypothetical protein AFLA_012607 [Aspergillus flavus NRRL3357]
MYVREKGWIPVFKPSSSLPTQFLTIFGYTALAPAELTIHPKPRTVGSELAMTLVFYAGKIGIVPSYLYVSLVRSILMLY